MDIVIRGAGDLASGIALRLHRVGIRLALCELEAPLAVRRLVSFSEAIYQGAARVEGVVGRRVSSPHHLAEIQAVLDRQEIPVVVDPQGDLGRAPGVLVVVDARMLKTFQPPLQPDPAGFAPLHIGLGPGFEAGVNCDAVIETQRGHTLGRVLWRGAASADTGQPEAVLNQGSSRVLRAPAAGVLAHGRPLGSLVKAGEVICQVDGRPVQAPFDGALRGLLPDGCSVSAGLKIGDLDPRGDPALCSLVSDKSLAVGGSVLEAVLSQPALRRALFRTDTGGPG